MHITGHQLKGNVLDSLLDKQIDLFNNKQNPVPVSEATKTIFGTRTDDPFQHFDDERKEYLLSELKFAAENAKVNPSKDQIEEYIKTAESDKLKGKQLEKFARTFCNTITRNTQAPLGTTRLSTYNLSNGKQVVSATCNNEEGLNDCKTGGYLGMKHNPNTIMNPDVLQKVAQTKSLDELRKEEKEYNKNFKTAQKNKIKEEQEESSKDVMRTKIVTAGTSETTPTHQPNQSKNILSIFSNDRDFAGIPEQTEGEKIKKNASERSEKASKEYDGAEIKPTIKLASSLVDSVGKTAKKDDKWMQHAEEKMEEKGTKGTFTEYCGGKVTEECIEEGKKSPNSKTRQRANFADNVKKSEKTYIVKKSSKTEMYNKIVESAAKNNNIVKLKDGFEYSAEIKESEIVLNRLIKNV